MDLKWVDLDLPDLTGALSVALSSEKDSWEEGLLHVSDLAAGLESQQDRMCRKGLWLRLRGENRKETSLWQRMMWDHGSRIEERVNDLIKGHLGDWVLLDQTPEERRVVLPGNIIGTYDAMLESNRTGKRVILDNKTVRGRAFNFLETAKASHVMQVRGYLMGTDLQDGMLWYIDREGQNHPKTFHVERNDDSVEMARDIILQIAVIPEPPLPMRPKFGIKYGANKTSITADLPWQCDWCDYLDISCKGALPAEMRSSQGRVVGWVEVTDGDGLQVLYKREYADTPMYHNLTFGDILHSEEESIIHEVMNKWYPEEGSD